MGALTPVGLDVKQLYAAQIAGRSGVAPITRFDASAFPTRFAGEVKGFDLGRFVDEPGRWNEAGANTRFALAASRQALEDASLLGLARVDPTRFGVYLGSGEGIQDLHRLLSMTARSYRAEEKRIDPVAFSSLALREYRAGVEYEQELHTTPAHIAETYGL
jgi:3-oxoacyl-[acyl-carrier-protein] synthase II